MVLTRITIAILTSLSTENEYTLFYHVFIHYYITHHWKDWCWIWNSNTLATWYKELTHWKRPWFWERLKARGEGDDRGWDGWHQWLNGYKFEQAPGVGDGQGSLAHCSPWVCKESDTTEWLNWTDTHTVIVQC